MNGSPNLTGLLDLEAPPPPLEGYDKLAALLAREPRLSFFRRFVTLGMKNLFYYQAELSFLERELEYIVREDRASENPAHRTFSRSFWDLKDPLNERGVKSAQWQKVLEIRELLDKYYGAVLQQSQIMRLSRPERKDLERLQSWLKRPEGGNDFFLYDPELKQWSSDNESDLIALYGRQEGEDNLTRWIYWKVIPWFHTRLGERSTKQYDPELGIWQYSDQRVKFYVRLIGTICSAILPASAMMVLYFVKQTTAQLIIIFVYNLMFSLVLGFTVKARPIEVFAAAIAFAAVQVTMVTNLPGSS